MKVCLFGHYAPDYSRNRVLIKGLLANGVIISKSCRHCDVIFVPFPGNEDMPMAWLLGKIFHKQVVFDAFISRYDTKVLDRKEYSPNSFKGRTAFFWDWIACLLADKVLLDTESYIDYFVKTFSFPKSKFYRVFVGTDEDIFFPRKRIREKEIVVGFHGFYIPLQGTVNIIEAAHILRDNNNLVFRMVGKGPDFQKCLKLAQKLQLKNIEFLKPVPYESLPNFIAQADIYLGGPFGESGKAGRVIPNKVYEALAMGKPVIVGDSLATRELLTDRKDCYIVNRGDPEGISVAIKNLIDDSKLRKRISKNGLTLFKKKLTTKSIGKILVGIFDNE